MGKVLAVVAVAMLAVVVVQAVSHAEEGVVVVTNPAGGPVKTVNIGPQTPGASAYGAYVPAVPTPPGVIGQYSPLPCTYPTSTRVGGWNVEYLVRELSERE